MPFASIGVDEPQVSAMERGAINKAQGAIRQVCPEATGNLSYSVQTVSSCFVDGFVRTVYFYRLPNCPQGQICPLYIELIGSVTLD